MRPSVLIAGMGQERDADDGFGVEVVRQLSAAGLPRWVRAADYGSGGMRLAFDLLDRYSTTVLVDAVPRGLGAGTVTVREVPGGNRAHAPARDGFVDVREMRAGTALDLLDLLGGDAGRVLVVTCEPGRTERGAPMSEAVRGAVPEAVRRIEELVAEEDRRLVHATAQGA
jgi:hydrogenase maturation protease